MWWSDVYFIALINMNSTTTLNALYGNFCLKKNKVKWTGTLEGLKAFVATDINENIAESASWRSPGGGTWNFDSELLSVTWHKTSENIYFKGEKGNDLTKRVYSFPTASESAAETADPVEAELEKSMEKLLADDVDVTSDNIFNEPFCLAVSTPARVLKPIDRGEAAKELRNRHWEHEEAISNLESTKASSKPTNENLHRGLPILHTATNSHNPSGSIDKSNNGASEIGLLKSKLEKFADNVTTKLADLAYTN